MIHWLEPQVTRAWHIVEPAGVGVYLHGLARTPFHDQFVNHHIRSITYAILNDNVFIPILCLSTSFDGGSTLTNDDVLTTPYCDTRPQRVNELAQ